MRILILNWRDLKHPLAGGAEISTHEHAKRWVKSGHEVMQISSSIKGEESTDIIDGVKIIRGGNHYTVHIFAFFYYLRNLYNKIDLVIDEFHFIPFFTPLYIRAKKVAFINEIAGEIWFNNQPFPISLLGYLIEPIVFKLYKKIFFMTASNSTKNDLVRFGISNKNILIIHNGLSSINSHFNKEETPVIIYVGRLAEDKGTKEGIIAFYHISKKIDNVEFWIVGKEEKNGYKNMLEDLVKRLEIETKVKFLGYVSEKKKFDFLKKAWILINPSLKEGWGLTVVEAASQGTPTVAYNVCGLCDSIINNKTGLLVNRGTAVDLAEAVIEILTNKSLYKKLSRNALVWSQKFDWKDSTSKSLKLIESEYDIHI